MGMASKAPSHSVGGSMADDKLRSKLDDHVEDARAMEHSGLKMLDSMISR
jgi:hypothetical protein